MKKIDVVKKIAAVIITLALTIALVQVVGHILDPYETQDGLDAIDAFHSLEQDSLDVIVFGSSRAWKGCNTRFLQDEYNLQSYNYGCHWQSLNTTLLFLKDALRTQSPKYVCIEMGRANIIEEDVELNGQIYYTRQISNFDGKKEFLNQCFGNNYDRYIPYYIPLTMFHDNWTEIDFENFYFPGTDRYIESRGYSEDSNTVVEPFEVPEYISMHQEVLPEKSVEILDSMVSICNENNISLILFTCPCGFEYRYGDFLKKYAAENDCIYLDFYELKDSINFDGNTDFQDDQHLNVNGATKIADYLGKYITEN